MVIPGPPTPTSWAQAVGIWQSHRLSARSSVDRQRLLLPLALCTLASLAMSLVLDTWMRSMYHSHMWLQRRTRLPCASAGQQPGRQASGQEPATHAPRGACRTGVRAEGRLQLRPR